MNTTPSRNPQNDSKQTHTNPETPQPPSPSPPNPKNYKTYTLTSPRPFSHKNLRLNPSDPTQPPLIATVPFKTQDQRPQVQLRATVDATGPDATFTATAEVRRSTTAREFEFRVADPVSGVEAADAVGCRGFTECCFEFPFRGCWYSWERTHDALLGASRWSASCYRLVEGAYAGRKAAKKAKGEGEGDGRVLMVLNSALLVRRDWHRVGEFRVEEGLERALVWVGLVTGLGIWRRDREAAKQGIMDMARRW
ncbi:hypothetical protein MBLNU230_g8094t1 [Neophaeotheca triangularis]